MFARKLFIRGEGLAVRAVLRVNDRFTAPLVRRRRLSPYLVLVTEAAEWGADLGTADALARRLLEPGGDGPGTTLWRLQKEARSASGHRPPSHDFGALNARLGRFARTVRQAR